jgi:glutamate-5-semialdehyde dehydrogenase
MADTRSEVRRAAERAKDASRALRSLGRAAKDRALEHVAKALEAEANRAEGPVLAANAADLAAGREAGLEPAFIDRLALNPDRLRGLAKAMREIAAQDDPVGSVRAMNRRPSGILVGRVRVPLGVVAMVYEARPNVTLEAFALTLKSGNAVILRGGKEAVRSNVALGELARHALEAEGLPADAAFILPPGSGGRDEIRELVSLSGLVDLAIPRGGEGLIRFVTENARVPVIQHYKGVCHMFIDAGADLDQAERLVENAKLSRVGVCNALECLLVHRTEAERFLPRLSRLAEKGLELRGDEATCRLVTAKPASDADWGFEFLAPILAVRVVDDLDGALDHIARYGSNHSEAIVTSSYERGQRFLREVDASCVLINASTRFNDGGELGLGAEMGVSTSKIHAYGPMGLEHLTTEKWIVYGEGQIR